MRLIAGIYIIWMMGTGALAATINISGTVKDGEGDAIAGAVVSLVSVPSMKDTTTSNGEFTIASATPIIGRKTSDVPIQNSVKIGIQADQLFFSIGSSANTGVISIFTSDGISRAIIPLGKMNPGTHTYTLPKLAPGIYVMYITIDEFGAMLKLVAPGGGPFISGNVSEIKSTSRLARMAAASATDTLIVEKEGFETAKYEITSYEQSGIEIIMVEESSGPTLPPITDYFSKGPFNTVVERNVGPGGGYTVFRPDPLGEDGFLHAPIVFGPGIGQTVQPVHTEMLTNFASHGFVVVGTPVLNQGPGGAQNLRTMQDGLDWIVEQNEASGQYQGKLWADHCVSMGFSVGGTSAVELGGQDPVFTVVSIHGHTAEADLHGPMLQTTGTRDGVGMPLQQNTYDASNVQTFLATLTNAPHGEIEQNGGGEERKAIVAWMRYWIYNDTGARHFFFGDDCVLCTDPWENPQRKNWE